MRNGDDGAGTDEAALRRLIAEGAPEGSAGPLPDAVLPALTAVLGALAAAPEPDASKGEEEALAAFRAARAVRPDAPAAALGRAVRRLARFRSTALCAAAAAGVLGGGMAAASGGGVLPFPPGGDSAGTDRVEHSPTAPPDPAPARTPDGEAAGRGPHGPHAPAAHGFGTPGPADRPAGSCSGPPTPPTPSAPIAADGRGKDAAAPCAAPPDGGGHTTARSLDGGSAPPKAGSAPAAPPRDPGTVDGSAQEAQEAEKASGPQGSGRSGPQDDGPRSRGGPGDAAGDAPSARSGASGGGPARR